MRKPLSALGLSVFTLFGCGQQEPAAAPLAAPPPAAQTQPAAAAPVPGDTAKEAPKPTELTPEQVAKLYQDCWSSLNAKDFGKFKECFSDTSTTETVDQGMPALVGKEEIVERGVKQFAAAFPDLVGEAQLTLVNGTRVVSAVLVRGTNKAPMMGPSGEIPATNKRIGYVFGHVAETQYGKVMREQHYTDMHTFLGQLGLAPGPVRKAQEQGAADKPLVIATGSEVEKANLEVFKKYSEALDKHDAPALSAVLADDFVYSDQAAPADLTGKKEAERGLKEMWKGFSDMKMTPASLWAAGDYVVATGQLSGTNDGPVPSMKLYKKTGKKVAVSYLAITRVDAGKVKKQWVFSNGLAFANQLGLMPPPKDDKAKPVAKADGKGSTPPGGGAASTTAPSAKPAAGASGPATTPAPAKPATGGPATTPAPAPKAAGNPSPGNAPAAAPKSPGAGAAPAPATPAPAAPK
jgi:predicted ester cyclase